MVVPDGARFRIADLHSDDLRVLFGACDFERCSIQRDSCIGAREVRSDINAPVLLSLFVLLSATV